MKIKKSQKKWFSQASCFYLLLFLPSFGQYKKPVESDARITNLNYGKDVLEENLS